MNKVIVAALTLLTLVASQVNGAQTQIQFQDLHESDIAQIKKRFPQVFSANPKLSDLDEVIRYLTRLESYSQIQLDKTNGLFTLSAIPLKKIGEIIIAGNKEVEKEDVLAALNMKIGSRFDSGKIHESGERLKEYYGRKGFLNTIVSFNFEEMSKTELRVLIRIREREPCLIENVVINTPNKDLKEKLGKSFKKYIRRHFTEENIINIEQSMNEYLEDHRFINSKIEQKDARYNSDKTKVTLTYDLVDPYAYEIIVRGSKYYEPLQVRRRIQPEKMTRGGLNPGQEVAEMVREYYLQQGFAHVKVSFQDRTLEKSFIKQIFIDVEEGPRVRIESLDVVGRLSRPNRYYSDFIRKNSSDQIEDRFYVKPDLDNGYKNLITDLNNQGFLKAKIQSARVEFNEKKDRAKITVVLDEGPLTQLSKITFYGVQSFSESQLLDTLSIKSNSPLRLNELEKSIELLKKFYFDRGFIEMRILNDDETLVEYGDKGLQASVNFKIEEGPQVYVKSIYIDGNTFTKDYVILKEVNIDIGDLLTLDALEEGKKRLEKMAIFSRVELRTLEANTNVSQRTLIISISERNPGLFKFGAGITNKNDLTARGFAGLSYNNIGGTARAVSIRGTLENNLVHKQRLEYEISVGYLEPFIFQKRLRGRANYSRSEKISNTNDLKLFATDKFTFSVEKDLTSKIKFSWLAWGFDSVEQFSIPEDGPKQRDSRQEIAYIGPSLDIDYRDNPFLPTEGTYTKIDAEYSSPFLGSSEKIEFYRVQGNFTHYLQLGTPKIIWANSIRGGYEENLSALDGSGIPISFSFFLGGYSTIRGYSGTANDRIPSAVDGGGIFPADDESQLIIPTSSTFYLLKSEVRFPLWKDPFGGVLFYDAGQVDVEGIKFLRPYRQSVGIGIRINTPVGPISLDYARKIAPLEEESPDHWHLSIGTF